MTTTAAQKTEARTQNTPLALALVKGATAAHELARIASEKGIKIHSMSINGTESLHALPDGEKAQMLAAGWDGSTIVSYSLKGWPTQIATTRRLQSGRKVWREKWYGAKEGCDYDRGQRGEFFLVGDVACNTIIRRYDVEQAAEAKRGQRTLRSA